MIHHIIRFLSTYPLDVKLIEFNTIYQYIEKHENINDYDFKTITFDILDYYYYDIKNSRRKLIIEDMIYNNEALNMFLEDCCMYCRKNEENKLIFLIYNVSELLPTKFEDLCEALYYNYITRVFNKYFNDVFNKNKDENKENQQEKIKRHIRQELLNITLVKNEDFNNKILNSCVLTKKNEIYL